MLPYKVCEDLFQKIFYKGTKAFSGHKNYGEGVLNRRTNDQI